MASEVLVMVVKTRAGDVEILLERHKAPLIVERLLKTLPTEVIFANLGSYVVLQLSIEAWVERSYKKFSPGDVAYDPMQRAIVVFISEGYGRFKPIGKVTSGLEALIKAPSPAPVKVELKT